MGELRATSLRGTRLPALSEVEGWIGWRVDDLNGMPIGEVHSVIDGASGSAGWIVVCAFGMGEGRRYVIPAGDAVGDGGRVWSPHPCERIRMTARIVGASFSPAAESRLRDHYARIGHHRAA